MAVHRTAYLVKVPHKSDFIIWMTGNNLGEVLNEDFRQEMLGTYMNIVIICQSRTDMSINHSLLY